MINAHLMWSLDRRVFFLRSNAASGRITVHWIISFVLKHLLEMPSLKKEHVLTIFFDLEKAYDTMWKHSILVDLWDLSFRGHLHRFIQNFLSERSFRVRVASSLSKLHEQEMGVLQCSILSPALFSIKINNIVKAVLKGTDCSLFVDNCFVCEWKDVKQSGETYAAVCKQRSEVGV